MTDVRAAEVINKFTEHSVLKEGSSKATIISNPHVNAQIHIGWRSMEIVVIFIALFSFCILKIFWW